MAVIKMKFSLFGRQLIAEQLGLGYEKSNTHRCLILHTNRLMIVWNLIILILLLYSCILVPIQVSFLDSDVLEGDIGDKVLGLVVDFLFTIDLVVNFFSEYELSDGTFE
jgi:hypothetical protein